ncbi:Methyltransferase domain-containing protein [Maribacter ulvicola]|uniref:Methyltransferase domain-containing protein n=2 Tax=Maribacter ulvicola TaxID=228959 RepID=A0A1N6VK53_9FLAO|nr:Methyltransferase domain-containing protein [Maribacter ulvicola]
MTIAERLMRGALVKKLDPIDDHDTIAELNRNFWVNKSATELFTETADGFEKDFLPNCTFIFEKLKKELSNTSESYTTLVEIGTGNGDVLNYLSAEFPEIKRCIGIDLSTDQIAMNIKKFENNKKLEFIRADAFDWVRDHGESHTIFVSSRGVLEYFMENRLQAFLKEINLLGKTMFVAIEPNGGDHDFETTLHSQLYGDEPSFSHNYPHLFRNAGFSLWHSSQKPWGGERTYQTFIGAKN